MPNGNTLITVSTEARIFEINDDTFLWEYQLDDGQMIARSQKYPSDYFPSLEIDNNILPTS